MFSPLTHVPVSFHQNIRTYYGCARTAMRLPNLWYWFVFPLWSCSLCTQKPLSVKQYHRANHQSWRIRNGSHVPGVCFERSCSICRYCSPSRSLYWTRLDPITTFTDPFEDFIEISAWLKLLNTASEKKKTLLLKQYVWSVSRPLQSVKSRRACNESHPFRFHYI